MKLIAFKHLSSYRFLLTFENGETLEADLQALIGHHVDLDALDTARLDADWGCLEFNGGTVDIEPKTLFRFAGGRSETRVAA